MTRTTLSILTVVVLAPAARAQPDLPARPIGGTNAPLFLQPAGPPLFLQPQAPRFGPRAGMYGGAGRPFAPRGGFAPGYFPYPAYGFGYGYGYGGAFGYGAAPPVVIEVAPPAPAAPPERTVVLANEFPATLTVQFPAAADVWLNGKPVDGAAAEERVLTSPTLKPGERFTFDVRARWSRAGKTYEANHSVALSPGDRSRLLVVSGAEVK